MKQYRIYCRFERKYTNPFTGRIGRWRVLAVFDITDCEPIFNIVRGHGCIIISSTRTFKKGSIISPRKEMIKYVKQFRR